MPRDANKIALKMFLFYINLILWYHFSELRNSGYGISANIICHVWTFILKKQTGLHQRSLATLVAFPIVFITI